MKRVRVGAVVSCLVMLLAACGTQSDRQDEAGEPGIVWNNEIADATPDWAIRPGNEFWKVAAPVDPAGVVERVRHAFHPSDAGPAAEDDGYRALIQDDALHFTPQGMKTPFTLRVAGISGGGRAEPLAPPEAAAWSIRGNVAQTISNEGLGLVTHAEARAGGVQLTWILPRRPAEAGELRLELATGGLAFLEQDSAGLHFADARGLPQVVVGPATLVDARGRRWPLVEVPEDAGLTIAVSSAVLDAAVFPVAIDPLVSAEQLASPGGLGVGPALVQQDPAAAYSGGVWLVTWSDSRSGPMRIYGARVRAADGVVLEPAGVVLSSGGSATRPGVIAAGNRFFVTWVAPDYSIKGQVIPADQAIQAAAPLDLLASSVNPRFPLTVAAIGDHVLVAYSEGLNAAADIKGFSVDLAPAVPLASAAFTICNAANAQTTPSIAANGRRFLVTWTDARDNAVSSTDLYGTWVSPANEVSSVLGFRIAGGAGPQSGNRVATDGTDFLVTWASGTNIAGARVLDADGSVVPLAAFVNGLVDSSSALVAWAGTQYLVAVTTTGQLAQVVRIAADGTIRDAVPGVRLQGSRVVGMHLAGSGAGALLSAASTAFTGDQDIVTQRLDGEGEEAGSRALLPVLPVAAQTDTDVATLGDVSIVVWVETRDGVSRVLAARFQTSDGTPADPLGISLFDFQRTARPAVAGLGDRFLVASECADFSGSPAILLRSLSVQGLPDLSALLTTRTQGTQVDLAAAGDGFWLVWENRNAAQPTGADIGGQFVVAQGNNAPTPVSGELINPIGDQTRPRVAWSGSQALVVWNDAGDIRGLSLRRGVPSGAILTISNEPHPQQDPVVAYDGARYLVAWQDGRNDGGDIYGARVSPQGVVQDVNGLLLNTAAGIQSRPQLGGAFGQFFLMFNEDAPATLRGAYISGALGAPEESPADVPAAELVPGATAGQVSVGNGHYLVSYTRSIAEQSYAGIRRITPSPPDRDHDGVSDNVDLCPNIADPAQPDADGDRRGDACDTCPLDAANDGDADGRCADVDNCPALANANQADADADARGDLCDNCPANANSNQSDVDADGRGDVCDACPTDAADDADGDGRCADADNCPDRANGDQADGDGDTRGDPCDPCPADAADDADGDGRCANVDNCPAVPNPNQTDADGDRRGDACDACALDPANDADTDGACADVDNCPAVANADQADADGDHRGDACDGCPQDAANDADADGRCAGADNCPAAANANQLDSDGDGRGDVCDACPRDAVDDGDGDGHCADLDNCPAATNANQLDADGDGRGDACDLCPRDAADDADHDSRCADADNCPAASNADQVDADGDGRGDTCDPCPQDAADDPDADGRCSAVDNCPAARNPAQADADGDGRGDACDPCPRDPADDADGDGDCAEVDNCPEMGNPGQSDADHDGVGDACDVCPREPENDADADGRCGIADNCPATANAGQADSDGDRRGDACDVCPNDARDDFDGDGRCADVDDCPTAANPNQADGDSDGVGDVCDRCARDPGDDADGDGLCGDVDDCPAIADPDQADADADDVGDACDSCPRDAANDADADGRCGDADNCPAATNADQADGDGDRRGDACDACPLDPADDIDGDGRCADLDNCPAVANPDQVDGDGDGRGDVCDPCPAQVLDDADRDGICDLGDNCAAVANPTQTDLDGDGRGDACDACPRDPQDDADGDGVCGELDNCPAAANVTQTDTDVDGRGDACDPCPRDLADDADDDGRCADADNCPGVLNADQTDVDGDGRGDACDACRADADDDADHDGRCADEDNCPEIGNVAQENADGDHRGDACDDCPRDADDDLDADGVCGDLDNCPAEACDFDTDGDAVPDGLDLCPEVPDPAQADTDDDDAGDLCDTDDDGDGIDDGDDDCPLVADAAQVDSDADGRGDACEGDNDGDGVVDATDDCPDIADPAQLDADQDDEGDACDADDDGDGVVDAVDLCPAVADPSQEDIDDDGLGDACDDSPPAPVPDLGVPSDAAMPPDARDPEVPDAAPPVSDAKAGLADLAIAPDGTESDLHPLDVSISPMDGTTLDSAPSADLPSDSEPDARHDAAPDEERPDAAAPKGRANTGCSQAGPAGPPSGLLLLLLPISVALRRRSRRT